jgi:hypothetical protein
LLVEDDVGALISKPTDGDEIGEVEDVEDVGECGGVRNAVDGAADAERSLADRVDDLLIGYLDLCDVWLAAFEPGSFADDMAVCPTVENTFVC